MSGFTVTDAPRATPYRRIPLPQFRNNLRADGWWRVGMFKIRERIFCIWQSPESRQRDADMLSDLIITGRSLRLITADAAAGMRIEPYKPRLP